MRRGVVGVVAVLVTAAACGTAQPDAATSAHRVHRAHAPSYPHGTVQQQAPATATLHRHHHNAVRSRPVVGKTQEEHRQSHGSAALVALAAVAVKGRAPMTGYDRDAFGPAWSDDDAEPFGHNGCDTRNDVLRRDLLSAAVEAGTHDCVVLSGTLDDPYTGQAIHFVRGETTSWHVQIDHVVALGDAWQTGAQHWSAEERQNFANDPLNLLAVDGSANESKGDGDAATWLPPNHAFRCEYVARQTAVKEKYGLWMTAAEKAAIGRILQACGPVALPVEPGRIHAAASFRVVSAPSTAPTRPPVTTAPGGGGSCEPGYSPCLPIVDDLDCDQIPDSLKPIRVTGDDPYRLDADGDGWGCES